MAYEIQAEKRTIFGKKVKNLRQAGKIPAEIYGYGTANNVSIQLDTKALQQVLKDAGNTNLISLLLEGQPPIQALARDIQYSTIKRDVLHVDFYAVNLTEMVAVNVPIHLIGESPLIEAEDGTLVTGINSLEIEALPTAIPESFEVDVSGLITFSDSISVSDLTLPEGVNLLSSPDSLVATIQPPRLTTIEEEEEAAALEEALALGELEGVEGEEEEGEDEDGEDFEE